MRIIGLKPWQWIVLAVFGLWVGRGAESTAELFGSVLGAVLLGLMFVYLKRAIQNRVGASTETEASP